MPSFIPGNIENYTIGGIRFYFTPEGGSELYFGNVVTGSFSSDINFLDHFTAQTGFRVKDRSLVQEITVTIALAVDEPTEELMSLFMLGSDPDANTFTPYTDLERRGASRIYGVSTTGNSWEWQIPLCTIQPDGEFSYNDQDWSQFSFNVEVLADITNNEASPYGIVTHHGTDAGNIWTPPTPTPTP